MGKAAILGGTPLFEAALLRSRRRSGKEEARALKRVLDAGQWGTLGDEALRFSKRFSEYLGLRYGVSTTDGALSLEIILRSFGIGRGDEVIAPSYTSASTVARVAATGAYPVLADAGAEDFGVDLNDVRAKITGKTRAVVVEHTGGRVVDMAQAARICREKGLYLAEDASAAVGSVWNGVKAGALSDAGVFGFSPDGALSCGEGGFIAVDDEKLFKEVWRYHNSGRSFDSGGELAGKILLGTNARMSEWPAAVLNARLDRLDAEIAEREKNAAFLKELLSGFEFLSFPREDPRQSVNSRSALLFFYDKTKFADIPKQTLIEAFRAEGVELSGGYPSFFETGAFESPSFKKSTGRSFSYFGIPNAKKLFESALWIKGSLLSENRETLEGFAAAFEKLAENRDGLRRLAG